MVSLPIHRRLPFKARERLIERGTDGDFIEVRHSMRYSVLSEAGVCDTGEVCSQPVPALAERGSRLPSCFQHE